MSFFRQVLREFGFVHVEEARKEKEDVVKERNTLFLKNDELKKHCAYLQREVKDAYSIEINYVPEYSVNLDNDTAYSQKYATFEFSPDKYKYRMITYDFDERIKNPKAAAYFIIELSNQMINLVERQILESCLNYGVSRIPEIANNSTYWVELVKREIDRIKYETSTSERLGINN